ncbi:MAG: hypothetical protein R3Y63_03465 [Eubacteriales bacterium]
MSLLIQCVIACILFTCLVLPSGYKDPVKQIMSYPPAIRKRVESLPEYQDTIQSIEKRHISVKIIAAFVFVIIFAVIAYYSQARTFSSAFRHTFLLFLGVNLFDTVVLDIGLFCHSKKMVISGTEDMVKEYRSPWHHVKGFFIGTVISIVVSLLSGSLIHFFVA